MELLAIEKLKKKDTLIYYRNHYEGTAVFSLIADRKASIRFNSTVEIKPTGERDVTVELLDSIDYPLLPILKLLKNKISSIDKKG